MDEVRSHFGIRSTREFLGKLGAWDEKKTKVTWTDEEGVERSVSYPTAKNYHSYYSATEREAPTFYLRRVAQVFGFRVEYLSTGHGPRTDAHASLTAMAPVKTLMSSNFGQGPLMKGVGAMPQIMDIYLALELRKKADRLTKGLEPERPEPDKAPETMRSVIRAFESPLEAMSIDPESLSDWQRDRYVTLVTQAISVALVRPDQLVPSASSSDSLIRKEASDA